MPERKYDVVVVGAGINGIACATYLQKAGLKTAVLERRNECGPFALTEDIFGAGVPVDTHAGVCFLPMSPVYGDLELDQFGLELLFPEVPAGTVWKDGTNLLYYDDFRKTMDSIGRYSPKDAKTMSEIAGKIAPRMVEILQKFVFHTPSEEILDEIWSLGEIVGFSPRDFRSMNAFELLDLLFEHEKVKSSLLGAGAIAVFGDPSEKGEGAFMQLLTFVISLGVPRGGMHTLVHSLVRCYRHHGGTLMFNAPVEKVEMNPDGSWRVYLSEITPYPFREIEAKKALVLHVSPPLALNMLGEDFLKTRDPQLWRKMRDWDMTGHCAFTSYVLLKGYPKWKSSRWNPDIAQCAFPLRAWDSWEHAKLSFQLSKNEELFAVAGDVGEIYNLAQVDPTRVGPKGETVLVYEVEYPINLRRYGGITAWDNREITDALHQKHLDDLRAMIDDFDEDLLDSIYFTPIDNWRRNPSAIFGHELGGDVSGAQWYDGRMPNRSSIPGLYFSQGVWPASLTHLGGGYVTACAIGEDLGVRNQPWWKSKPMERYLELKSQKGVTGRRKK